MVIREKRSDRIYLMVSQKEKTMFEAGAEALGYRNLSDFVRDTVAKRINALRGERHAA